MISTDIYRPVIGKLLKAGVSQEDTELFIEKLHHRSFRAKEHVFQQNDRQPLIVYVLKGYLQLYSTDEDGTTNVRILAGPGDFVGCVEATVYSQPAVYTAECITDCHFACIDHHVQELIRSDQNWFRLLQDFIIRRILALAWEKDRMLPLKATDRYLYFCERYPRFEENIPAGVIANYIGVRPQSLSRIKQTLK